MEDFIFEKSFIEIPEAAKYLSEKFKYQVTEQDIYDLATQEKISLTFKFTHGVNLIECELLEKSEAMKDVKIPLPFFGIE